jgi:hypothetical protein
MLHRHLEKWLLQRSITDDTDCKGYHGAQSINLEHLLEFDNQPPVILGKLISKHILEHVDRLAPAPAAREQSGTASAAVGIHTTQK